MGPAVATNQPGARLPQPVGGYTAEQDSPHRTQSLHRMSSVWAVTANTWRKGCSGRVGSRV
jgi:hypothetical protein